MEFWNIILYILWFFLLFAWIYLIVVLFTDLYSDDKESGWAKFFWTIFMIFFPLIGCLVYLIARGGGMGARAADRAAQANQAATAYIRHAVGAAQAQPGHSTADEISKLAKLKDEGTLTDAEFETQKAKLLA